MKRAGSWRIAACVAAFAAMGGSGPAGAQDGSQHRLTSAQTLRALPADDAPSVARLAAGDVLQLLDGHGAGDATRPWLRVRTVDGRLTGYLPADSLQGGPPRASTSPVSSSGSLFAQALAPAAQAPGAAGAGGAPPQAAPSSVFAGAARSGEIEAAHAQAAREKQAQQEAEAQRRRDQDRARQQQVAAEQAQAEADAARRRFRQRQEEQARAASEAEDDRLRQRRWAQMQAIPQRLQAEVEQVRRANERQLAEIQRQQQHEQRQREERERRAADARRGPQGVDVRPPPPGVAQTADVSRQQPREPGGSRIAQAAPPAAQPGATQAGSRVAPGEATANANGPAIAGPGSSGAGIRIEEASASGGAAGAGPGEGRMTKRQLQVGHCRVDAVTVRWNLGVLLGEPTVNGGYTWQGPVGCQLPASTVVLLHVRRAGEGGAWVALDPAVPRAGEASFNASGSPSKSALLCHYDAARRMDCLPAPQAAALWQYGSVSDFLIAW